MKKPRSNTARLIVRLIGIVALAALAWLGHHAGHYIARAGWFQRDPALTKPSRAQPSTNTSAATREPSATAKPVDVTALLQRIKSIAASSSNLMADFEALSRIEDILAKLTAAELAAVFEGIAASSSGDDFNTRFLLQKIGLAWVALDPTAAMTAALGKTSGYGQHLATQIFGEWSADDPHAALDWLNSPDLPADIAKISDDLRRAALGYLIGRDFDLATAEFLKMGSRDEHWLDPRGNLLSDWAGIYLDDPAMRERLVEFTKSTGRPEDYAKLNDTLLRQWPQDDPLGMLDYLQGLRTYLESDAVPADKRAEVDASAVGVAIYREYTRPALEWWMERYSQSAETPQPLREAIKYWAYQRPDEMQQWFTEQPPSLQRDALSASAAIAFTSSNKFQQATLRVTDIADPAIRQSAIDRLDYVWSRQDPQAAATWRATLPASTESE
jgi:hypothetical protein